ncbi:MAG: thermonuclease family protein [Alphaproteobacteria bacterium]|nr:thermonuclease family protein [Alphaproteobacteria bacterium]
MTSTSFDAWGSVGFGKSLSVGVIAAMAMALACPPVLNAQPGPTSQSTSQVDPTNQGARLAHGQVTNNPERQLAECGLQPGPAIAISSVSDAETLRLADGRELSLGTLAASLSDEAAIEHLNSIAASRTVVIYTAANTPRRTDRYARLLGHAVIGSAPEQRDKRGIWLQAELISSGLARIAPSPTPDPCTAQLLELEESARRDKRGHWANSTFQVLDALKAGHIAEFQSRFAIVEGTIRRASKSKGRTYLNFGRHWKNDFTALIPRRLHPKPDPEQSALENPQQPPTRLNRLPGKGDKVRIRGWVELRGGPLIAIDNPQQIEWIE